MQKWKEHRKYTPQEDKRNSLCNLRYQNGFARHLSEIAYLSILGDPSWKVCLKVCYSCRYQVRWHRYKGRTEKENLEALLLRSRSNSRHINWQQSNIYRGSVGQWNFVIIETSQTI